MPRDTYLRGLTVATAPAEGLDPMQAFYRERARRELQQRLEREAAERAHQCAVRWMQREVDAAVARATGGEPC